MFRRADFSIVISIVVPFFAIDSKKEKDYSGNMKYTIADLHCDLLCYLAGEPTRTPYDSVVRCSIPQMRAGGVCLQVLPIFTATEPGSVQSGQAQISWFNRLLFDYSDHFSVYRPGENPLATEQIKIAIAVENASSLISEEEDLNEGLFRLQSLIDSQDKVVYVSFTWNGENRFGGGAHTSAGLKSDGRTLLHFLSGKSIAVDLSHSSDALAYDILNEIDRCRLDIPLIASHSNARSVQAMPRNLPDELIKEIIGRNGVIGLNFVRYFVGNEPELAFVDQLERFISLGAINSLCFGADFFYGNDVPAAFQKKPEELFFPGYDNSSCYSHVIELWKNVAGVDEEIIEKISFVNLINYLESRIYVSTEKPSV